MAKLSEDVVYERQVGSLVVMGTRWPIYHQVTRLAAGKWLATFGICNGSAHSSQRFRTRREAVEAVDREA